MFTSRTYRLSHNSPVKSPGSAATWVLQDRLASWVGAGKKLRWPGELGRVADSSSKVAGASTVFHQGVTKMGPIFGRIQSLMQGLFCMFDVFFPVIRALFGLVIFF